MCSFLTLIAAEDCLPNSVPDYSSPYLNAHSKVYIGAILTGEVVCFRSEDPVS